MYRTATFMLLLLALLFSVPAWGAQESEMESLKQRINDLEEQNRSILKALEELRARLESGPPPAIQAAAPPPSQATAKSADKASPPTDNPVQWPELTAGKSRIQFYGFLRLDAAVDSQRPDNPQNPFYVTSADDKMGGPAPTNFTLHPRLTRFGINYSGPAVHALGDARLSGQLEIDFNNGGTESRAIPRIRHANLRLTHGSFYVLAGQTFDLFSPLIPSVNNSTNMWNAGNLGDRRAQVQAVYEPKQGKGRWYFGMSMGLTGAVDGRDLDSNGYRDGEESGLPNLQGRVGYSHETRMGQPIVFGVWGHRGFEYTTQAFLGMHDYHSQSVGIDYTVPLTSFVTLKGEAWTGRNLSDFRGGSGQGINPLTGAAIRSRGGWAELGFKVNKYWTISPGYTIDDPRDADIAPNGRVRNRAWYLGDRFSLGDSLILGADYLRWITDYQGLHRGADNRFNLFVQYAY